MRNKKKTFSMNMHQVLSPALIISILAIAVLCFVCVLQLYPRVNDWSGMNVFNFAEMLIGLSMFKKILVVLAAVPFVSSFCSDWNMQFIRPVIIRSGVRRYIWSKIGVCTLSSFITIFMGFFLFIFVCSIWVPVYPQDLSSEIFPPFEILATSSVPFLYLVIKVFIFSIGCSFWVITGLTISAFIPNRFVSLIVPLASSYIIEELTENFPSWINPYRLTRAKDVINQGAVVSFVYYVFIFALLICLLGLIFSWQVRRRIRNEIF